MLIENRPISLLVGVRFRPNEPVRYFDPGEMDLNVGDSVVVETDGQPREAIVVIAPDQVVYSELRGEMRSVLRKVASNVAVRPLR